MFAGTTEHAARVLQHLSSSIHEVVAVLTRTDAKVGRRALLTESPVAALATSLGYPVIKANSIDGSTLEQLEDYEPDLGVVIAYGSLLKRAALDMPAKGWLNIHYSLLPKWRGAAPVQRALQAGDHETGVTIFQLDEGMDSGPLLASVPTVIQPGESSGDLLNRLTTLGISALDESLSLVESGLAKFSPQVGLPSIAPKITRDDARISWQVNASEVENLVRAMNPEPGAWTMLAGEPFRILEARALALRADQFDFEKAQVVASDKKILARCGSNTVLEIRQVQPAGKSAMAAADWHRGAKNLESLTFNE